MLIHSNTHTPNVNPVCSGLRLLLDEDSCRRLVSLIEQVSTSVYDMAIGISLDNGYKWIYLSEIPVPIGFESELKAREPPIACRWCHSNRPFSSCKKSEVLVGPIVTRPDCSSDDRSGTKSLFHHGHNPRTTLLPP